MVSGYVYMTAGLKPTRVEISHVFTRGGLESSAKNSTSHFPTTRTILEKGSCKVHDKSFQPGLNCLHAFFQLFQPGLKSQISTRPLDPG